MLCIILLNTVAIALQTDAKTTAEIGTALVDRFKFLISLRTGFYLSICDTVFLGIYLFELSLKVFAQRTDFFTKGWNWFGMCFVASFPSHNRSFHTTYLLDLIIVLLSFLD